MIDNKIYDRLKTAALLVAPVIVFISSVCSIWNVPHTAEITATLAALDTLIGAAVAILKKQYDEVGR